jgi:hypothetical protein
MREMGMNWDDYFYTAKHPQAQLWKSIAPRDYLKFARLVGAKGTVKEVLHDMGPVGRRVVNGLCYAIDGVGWDVMSAREFLQSFNYIAFSTLQTQKISGYYMALAMQERLLSAGVKLHLGQRVGEINYKRGTAQGVGPGFIILAVDAGNANKIMSDNWGQTEIPRTYGAVTFMMKYIDPPKLASDVDLVAQTKWNILAQPLPNGDICCVLCNPVVNTRPAEELVRECCKQLNIPPPHAYKMCWGSRWVDGEWVHDQTSNALLDKPIPFFGKSRNIAMVGMMSERNIPFSSIEAAVEVGRRFTNRYFGVGEVLTPFTFVQFVVCIFIIVVIYKCILPRTLISFSG